MQLITNRLKTQWKMSAMCGIPTLGYIALRPTHAHAGERIGEAKHPGPASENAWRWASFQDVFAQTRLCSGSDNEASDGPPIALEQTDEGDCLDVSGTDDCSLELTYSSSGDSEPTKRGRPVTNHSRRNHQVRERYKNIRQGSPKRERGRPRTVKISRRCIRRRQLVEEKSLVQSVKEAFGLGLTKEGSELQLASMRTKVGKIAFGPLAAVMSENAAHAEVGRSVCAKLHQVGRSHMNHMVRWCAEGITDLNTFCELTGLTKRYVQSTKWGDRMQAIEQSRVFTERYTPNTTRKTVGRPDDQLAVDFFLDNTQQASGAKTNTRQLSLEFHDLELKFYADYPRRLRALNCEQPSLFEMIEEKTCQNKQLTRFEKSLRASVYRGRQANFDEERELATRTANVYSVYQSQLETKRLRTLGVSTSEARYKSVKRHCQAIAKSIQTGLDSDDATDTTQSLDFYNPHPMGQKRFWAVLHSKGIRWTRQVNPTECAIHDNGPQQELELKQLEGELLVQAQSLHAFRDEIRKAIENQDHSTVEMREQETSQAAALGKLVAKVRILRDKVGLYHKHLKQFEVCRAVVKRIEENLVPGECVLYRDFVALYNCEGNKVQNLVLVALWRMQPGEPLRVFKFSNYCDDKDTRSADAYYVADVFDFYFGQGEHHCKFFQVNNITKIYISGDHGPHFSSIQTIYNETTIYARYGIIVEAFSLCSYHAYNR